MRFNDVHVLLFARLEPNEADVGRIFIRATSFAMFCQPVDAVTAVQGRHSLLRYSSPRYTCGRTRQAASSQSRSTQFIYGTIVHSGI